MSTDDLKCIAGIIGIVLFFLTIIYMATVVICGIVGGIIGFVGAAMLMAGVSEGSDDEIVGYIGLAVGGAIGGMIGVRWIGNNVPLLAGNPWFGAIIGGLVAFLLIPVIIDLLFD